MSHANFEAEKASLNAEQRLAVETIQGPVMVIAGPGTGKTKILVLRIAEILLKTDTAPNSILALTFTEAGATVMKQRLINLIGNAGRKVRIETFHKFAMSIERDYPEYFGSEERKLLQDADKILGFEAALNGLILKTSIAESSNPFNQKTNIIRAIDDLRRQGITAEDFNHVRILFNKLSLEEKLALHAVRGAKKDQADAMKKFEDQNEDFYTIYAAYEQWIVDNHFYDFSSVIIEVREVIKNNEELKQTLQENFQYILADEYQDTNLQQHAVIMQLADVFDRQPNLFIVGDRKQSIYGFQGASKEIFNEVFDEFKNIKVIKLKENYRSAQNILDAAFSLSDYSKEALAAKGILEEGALSYTAYNEAHEMLFDLKQQIRSLIKQGVPLHEIGIISRKNKDLNVIKDHLIQEFPAIVYGNDPLFESTTINLMMQMLWAISHTLGIEHVALTLLMHPFFQIPMYDAIKLASFVGNHKKEFSGITLFELITNTDVHVRAQLSETAQSQLISMSKILEKMRATASTFGCTSALKEFLEDTHYFTEHIPSTYMITEMERTFNFFTLINEQELRTAHEVDPVKSISEALFVIQRHGIDIKKDKEPIIGNIALLTIHSSKGLEFEHVFLVNVDEKNFKTRGASFKLIPSIPHVLEQGAFGSAAESDDEESSDERASLLFVAMTRAKKGLYLSYVKGGRKTSNVPVEELDPINVPLVEFDMPEGERINALTEVLSNTKEPLPTCAEFGDFLMQKVKENGISSSKLFDFFDNPWNFILTTILRLETGETIYITQGNFYHTVVESVIESAQEGETITENVIKVLVEKLYEKFQEEHRNFSIDSEEVVGHVVSWWNQFNHHNMQEVFVERALDPFEVDGVRLNGRPDILVDTPHGVEIYDLKTSKKISDHVSAKGEIKGKYRTQLECYAAMVQNSKRYEGKPIITNALYFINNSNPETPSQYTLHIDSSLQDEVVNQMRTVFASLKELSFSEAPVGTNEQFQPNQLELALKKFIESLLK
ncbi:MAG TPA: ATP-dependent DNA helicase [Candidatus Paceibacterota bacterium]